VDQEQYLFNLSDAPFEIVDMLDHYAEALSSQCSVVDAGLSHAAALLSGIPVDNISAIDLIQRPLWIGSER